ncbi:stationary phase inducible protein CsiE [Erwinia endophytica]|uniref:stationary phase inducible protein CsiE n=1 Tax=Erwinia endophytica TaxID=1563158 RepID=UPI001265F4D4|nr:stationary phase inducible protein CsiE [Erwinia endophytica]KAB8308202.1 stationary phase inducible protein CsiE [Erwinia endophytica]
MSLPSPPHSAFSSSQRHCHLLLLLYLPGASVTLDSLCQLNGVDRSITRQDIAAVAEKIQHYHRINLHQEANGNYWIDGPELDLRLCLLHWLRRGLRLTPDFIHHHFATAVKQQLKAQRTEKVLYDERNLQALVQYCAQRLSREFNNRDRQFLLLFMQHTLCRRQHIEFSETQQTWLKAHIEYQVAEEIVHHWQKRSQSAPDASVIWLFSLLFSQIHLPVVSHIRHDYERQLLEAVRQMIEHFQKLSAVRFSDQQGLCSQLYTHLAQALERIQFGIGTDSCLTGDVVRLYPRLLRTTQVAVTNVEQLYGLTFSPEELGLIAIIFGAWLMQENALQEKQVLLLTGKDSQLEQKVEQQLRELTLLPLNIKYLDVEAYQRHGAPKGITLVITPYAAPLPLYSPPLIHAELPLQDHQQHCIRLLLES